MGKKINVPDYLFETAWEVCNRAGGKTVVDVKSLQATKELQDNHIFIGPDVWRETQQNPEFDEDPNLFKGWRSVAVNEGLRIRVGRWKVPGNPVAVLVDFTVFIPGKDEILTELWKRYGVDSLSGGWDYIESALFGYAAGKVIESFAGYYAKPSDRIVAIFHEWMAGAGLLYLKMKNLPVGTIFNTAETVAGSCIGLNEASSESELQSINAEQIAREHGATSRHSLEKAAAQNADVFTSPNETAAKACVHFLGRECDIVTSDSAACREAMEKVDAARGEYADFAGERHSSERMTANHPLWTNVFVSRRIPDRLANLDTIAKNLWWCWNNDAIELFKSIDPELWALTKGNPLLVLDKIPYKKYRELEKNSEFIARLDRVYAHFSEYMAGKSERKGAKIAYFCMEYGIDTSLKIYSGGLGILAGDYLKEASDMQIDMTAVGLLYKFGYFTQRLSASGDQIAYYEPQDFMKIPASPVRDKDGGWLTISIALPGRNMYARIWKVEVGRTDLFLLDTDIEENLPEDRQVTHQLYGGDWDNRLKQELLLGIGGIRAIRALGIDAEVYHCNEGHAAFCGIERLREYVQNGKLTFDEALEVVRASSLFTTHTPVPAGHDAFSEDMLRAYISHFPDTLKIGWKDFLALGRINPDNPGEKFSMSFLAANLSQEINGVSWLHGKVSQKILAPMWPGYLPEELNVSSVTNGVHYPTWTAPEWKAVHEEVFGEQFQTHHYDKTCFEGIYKVPDRKIWEIRQTLRKRLIAAVKDVMADTSVTSHYSPNQIVKIRKTLRDDVLTIGFARRFATYKRAQLLFSNLDRLSEIVNNPKRPVQFLFAGKAHPADGAGQGLIKRIIEISKMPQFLGKIVFVPNYDITLAKLLVQGVDVWMNNPTRPLEASGTSGEKAVMNGVMHFSVLDGWWVEGYRPGAGWALKQERTYDDQSFQDDLDSATIYNIIENEIAPEFYNVGENGLSSTWIATIKNTVAKVACDFTTNRMMTDYVEKYYEPLCRRAFELSEDDFSLARDIAYWKKKARRAWKDMEILSFVKPDNVREPLTIGKEYVSELMIRTGKMNPEDLGVEILFAEQDAKGQYHIKEKFDFHLAEFSDGVAKFTASVEPQVAGTYQVAGRIFAKNANLPHRQDFELVKWL